MYHSFSFGAKEINLTTTIPVSKLYGTKFHKFSNQKKKKERERYLSEKTKKDRPKLYIPKYIN